ncbi:MAG: cellulase family glycosylhydrolase [bacterium]
MKKSICLLFMLSVIISSCSIFTSEYPEDTMKVEGRFLYDTYGEKVILRGINEMFIWSPNDKAGKLTMPEIRKTGANAVRIVWTTLGSPAELDSAITNCINNQMIPIPELHDASGNLDLVAKCVDYWISPEMVEIINKHQEYVLLNIANEPGSYESTEEQFKSVYEDAIKKIRNAGLKVPLIIDGTDWGKNIDVLQSAGQYLISEDTLNNILFSIHIWWASGDSSTIKIIDELQQSVDMGIPLIVGEFAPMMSGCKKYIDYRTIIKECQKHQIGWLAWSWGNTPNTDCSYMDITSTGLFGNWKISEEFGNWGEEVCITDSFSIKKTSITPLSILNRNVDE